MTEVLVRWAYAAFYLRVIPSELDLRWHRYTVIFVISLYTVYQTFDVLYGLFQCGSPSNLSSTDPNVKCLGTKWTEGVLITTYSFDAAIDWFMAMMPLYIIMKSSMTQRMKLSVACILLLSC